MSLKSLALVSALALAGCVNLAPGYQRPAAPVPAQLPAADAAATTALPAWSALVRDDRTRQVVERALANNRDLRVAMLNVELSRAQLRITDADRWPTVNLAAGATREPNSDGKMATTLQAGFSVSSYEVDLLSRLRNLSDAAAANLLATESASRSARLSLVSQVVTAYLTLAADEELLALARDTLRTRAETLRLTTLRASVGAASDLDLRTAQTLGAQAEASLAQAERQRALDVNALNLVVGEPLAAELLPPAGARLAAADWLAPVPVGLPSDVLLARPDVMQAEQLLIAANANIGAARAAMFPRITLSSSAGVVSDTLKGLVNSGTFAWSLAGQAAVAIFDAGRNRANVKVSEVNRDIAVAQYEKALQTAFKEAADGLVSQGSWTRQVRAQQDLLAAESERTRLTRLKLQQGAASLLDTLDAERSLVSANQALVQARLSELLNRLALYQALGGDETLPQATAAAPR
ncbi:MAG TPA: efflux transporter outer membrane subunit [Ideonella sp.]|nr:efflux transporter outer membrane subunit [Ideonella sp.]